jgi:hypothetical protein
MFQTKKQEKDCKFTYLSLLTIYIKRPTIIIYGSSGNLYKKNKWEIGVKILMKTFKWEYEEMGKK